MSAKELPKLCAGKLKITVSEPERAVSVIAGKYGDDSVSSEGNVVLVSGHNDESAEINRLLFENGFSVSAVESVTGDIESYFINLMGGAG